MPVGYSRDTEMTPRESQYFPCVSIGGFVEQIDISHSMRLRRKKADRDAIMPGLEVDIRGCNIALRYPVARKRVEVLFR